MWTIYSLSDPHINCIRYIGITQRSLVTRLSDHIRKSRAGEQTHRARWIRKLLEIGLRPVINTIEITTDMTRECYWIKYFKDKGFDLVNTTLGGDGWGIWTPERRLAQAIRQRGRKASPITIKRMSEARKGHKHSPKTRELLRQINLGKKFGPMSDIHKAKISAAKLGHTVSESVRKKISEKLKGKSTGRKRTYCPNEHPYDAKHTFINIRGSQECRTCRAIRDRLRYLISIGRST